VKDFADEDRRCKKTKRSKHNLQTSNWRWKRTRPELTRSAEIPGVRILGKKAKDRTPIWGENESPVSNDWNRLKRKARGTSSSRGISDESETAEKHGLGKMNTGVCLAFYFVMRTPRIGK